MPSQNLPKPNLPGQTAAAPVAAQTDQATASSTVSNQQPNQIRQAQIIPGGLSRENPGGTPPNMKVAAPFSSTGPSSQRDLPPAAPPIKPLPNRPMGPLDQLELKNDLDLNARGSAATINSQNTHDLSARVNTSFGAVAKDSLADVHLPTVGNLAMNATNNKTPLAHENLAPLSTPAENVEGLQQDEADKSSKKSSNPLSRITSIKGKIPKPLLIGGIAVLIILLGLLVFGSFNKPKTATSKSNKKTTAGDTATAGTTTATGEITTLTYWGLWEDSQILKEVIADFESKNPTIKIDYRKQSHRDYRERLQQAIASGSGPDIFRYHTNWVPMLSSDLAAMPSTIMSTAEYKEIFYPSAYNNLQVNGQIVGIPLMYEGLALFYNKEMLRTANIEVPTTWAELRTAANKLTVPADTSERQNDNITRAGLAIGNAGNVDHFSDILALLIIQNGGSPADADSQYVKDALTFYTNFVKQDKVWSDRLANSTVAFAQGDVAMIFAPSWRAHDIKNLNPNLDFAAARVPQLDSQNPMAWATFWAEGVSNKSQNKEAAWTFLKYLSTPEVLRKFYNDASQYRAFGEIYPRVDMAAELKGNELVAAFVEDAPIAKSWYMASFTHDNGLNDQIIKYYEDAITAVLSSTDFDTALETLVAGVNSVLTKYNSK